METLSDIESFPIEIIFRNLDRSAAIEDEARRRLEKLNHFYNRIQSCRLTIELEGKHHTQGRNFDVRIDMSVPGEELVVSHAHRNEDVYVALKDATASAKRRLEEFAEKHRHAL